MGTNKIVKDSAVKKEKYSAVKRGLKVITILWGNATQRNHIGIPNDILQIFDVEGLQHSIPVGKTYILVSEYWLHMNCWPTETLQNSNSWSVGNISFWIIMLGKYYTGFTSCHWKSNCKEANNWQIDIYAIAAIKNVCFLKINAIPINNESHIHDQ